MEETVRSMLVYKKQAEQLRQEKAALTVAFEVSNMYFYQIYKWKVKAEKPLFPLD